MVPPDESVQLSRCEVQRKLAEAFATAARLYAEAVVLCTRHPAGTPHGEHQRLRLKAREAQERVELARRAYEDHVESHGCGDPDNLAREGTTAIDG